MKLSREETFLTHRGRPRTKIKLKIGMKNDGRFTACGSSEFSLSASIAGCALRNSVFNWLNRFSPSRTFLISSVSRVQQFIAEAEALTASGAQIAFAIVHGASGAAIGSTRYLDLRPPDRALEIGWTWLGTAHQRTPVNTECKLLLLEHAFETLGAVRVQFKTDDRNRRSQAAIERIGGRREGVLRKSLILRDGFIRDSVYYSIIDDEWPAVKQRLLAMLDRHAEQRRP